MSHEYKTKEGLPITFKAYDADPVDTRGISEGWVVHRIDAFLGDLKVGYLKISYIPQAYADRVFPTLWHYLKNHRGYRYIEDPDDLDSVYRGLVTNDSGYRWNNNPKLAPPPESKKDRDRVLKGYRLRLESDYNFTLKYLVGHPFVDYINVEFDGQGIGTALYKYGARWLAKTKGLALYASSLQSEEAKRAWLTMRKPIKRIPVMDEPHPTLPDKTRTKIDYRKMAAELATHYLGSRLIQIG